MKTNRQISDDVLASLVDVTYEMGREIEKMIIEIERMTNHIEASRRFGAITSELAELKNQVQNLHRPTADNTGS